VHSSSHNFGIKGGRMNIIEKLELIERVDALTQRKATGTPKDLSNRLSVSTRNVFYIINTMKELGAPISFCKFRNSYFYEEEVKFTFGFKPLQQYALSS